MVAYTSAFLAAANLIAIAQAAPAYAVCQVVVDIFKGDPIWVPNSGSSSTAVWSAWDPKATSTSTSTTTSAWSAWDPKATSTSTTTSGWGSWTTSASVKPTSTTWSGPWSTSSSTTWSHPYPTTSSYSSSTTWSSYPTTSWTSTTTKSSTTTTTTTTTSAPATATCSSGNYDFDVTPAGSCGCEYTVECNMHAAYDQNTKFWEQTSGQLVDTLEQCVELCNNNSACQATVWSAQDPTDTQDYKRCWQISGLGATQSTGFGQISRKTSCSGSCSANYSG